MRRFTKISLMAMAAVLTIGASDAAFAARKKHRAVHRSGLAMSDYDQRKHGFDRNLGLEYDDNGVPIIMKGFNTGRRRPVARSAARDEDQIQEQPRGRSKLQGTPRPYGSSGYVAPVLPKSQQPVTQSTVQPYNPPKTNTFSDRVTNCIHSYPLNAGIGNNPRDQQSYIRQCAN
jgi:hypothetical protein